MICKVTVSGTDDRGHRESRDFDIQSFTELEEFLDDTYAEFLQQLGENPYGPPPIDKHSGEIIGGFGVRCRNAFGGHIEVGIGREWWLLIDLVPEGGAFIVDDQPPDHDFIFFLDGWEYTGIGAEDVISRDKCLIAIEKWLEGVRLERKA